MTSPAKLTDLQLAILSGASRREDRCLIAPGSLKGGAAHKLAAKLLMAGLVREIKAKAGMEAWRRDKEKGEAYALKLTNAGLKAIAAADKRDTHSIPGNSASPNTNEDPSKANIAADMATSIAAAATVACAPSGHEAG